MNPAAPSASVAAPWIPPDRSVRFRVRPARRGREPRQPGAGDEVARTTPVMEQFIEIKAANPDCLLF